MRGPLVAGISVPRIEGMAKIRGEERYASDITGPGILWAVARRAGTPSGILRSLGDEPASMDGVVAVCKADSIEGENLLGILEPDQPVLVPLGGRIRYRGDPVAVVVADTRERAEAAARALTVEIAPLPAVFDPLEALSPEAPVLYPGREGGNLLASGWVRRGDVKSVLEDCDLVEEDVFRFPMQEHAYLETESGVALYDGENLEMEVSTQNPWRDRDELSRALGLPRDRIRVKAPCLGGGFGGKDGVVIQGLLGVAAMACPGRTVKMVFSREESFLCSPKRHSSVTEMTLGCSSDGTLRAIRCRFTLDSGAYASMSVPVLTNGLDHCCGGYRFEAVDLEGRAVYTNNPFGGAFRAFGAPQVMGALEQLVDRLAKRLEADPLEFRKKNGLVRGDMNGSGVVLTSTVGAVPCLDRALEQEIWRSREEWRNSAPEGKARSTGAALICHGQGFGPGIPDFANARIELTGEGRFRLYSGIPDMGQGNGSTYVHLAGESLCQERDRFDLVQPDTDRSLRSGPAAASRTTYIYGRALLSAVDELKRRMYVKAGMVLGAREDDLALLPGRVRCFSSGRELPLEVLAGFMEPPERCSVAGSLAPVSFPGPETDYGPKSSGFPHCIFSWAVHVARVEVDLLTGQVSVPRYLAVTEAGRVVNPQMYRQQIEGGVAQGLGYALFEDFSVKNGEVTSKDLSTYIVPTSMDLPEVECLAVELDEPSGPKGLKGLGELPLIGPLPAVANGLAHICGPLTVSPFTAERVFFSLSGGARDEDRV